MIGTSSHGVYTFWVLWLSSNVHVSHTLGIEPKAMPQAVSMKTPNTLLLKPTLPKLPLQIHPSQPHTTSPLTSPT